MISKDTLPRLAVRIDRAKGYDRDINISIFENVYLARFPKMIARGRDERSGGKYEFNEGDQRWILWSGGTGTYPEPPPYTTSVDAILELTLKLFPNWTWSLSQNSGERPEAWIAHPTENSLLRTSTGVGSGETPALALCAALIDLLVSRPTQPVDE